MLVVSRDGLWFPQDPVMRLTLRQIVSKWRLIIPWGTGASSVLSVYNDSYLVYPWGASVCHLIYSLTTCLVPSWSFKDTRGQLWNRRPVNSWISVKRLDFLDAFISQNMPAFFQLLGTTDVVCSISIVLCCKRKCQQFLDATFWRLDVFCYHQIINKK